MSLMDEWMSGRIEAQLDEGLEVKEVNSRIDGWMD